MVVPDTNTRLAHLELLDELLSDDQRAERQRIYDELVPTYTDPADQAYRVFEIVSQEATGMAASVADQRLAQYDILLNAASYAALGRMTVEQIRDARWWAPNWAWSRVLAALDPEQPWSVDEMARLAERLAPQLLEAGAEALVGFYGQIARRAGWTVRLRSGIISTHEGDERSVVATLKHVRERRRLFRDGPRMDGHYLPGRHLQAPV